MRYIITGGLGVVGSQIARRLLSADHEVLIIDPAEEPRNQWIRNQPELREARVRYERLEQMDRYILNGWVEWADRIVHCAASTGIPYSVTRPSDDWERNVEGTRALLEALRVSKHPAPTVVLSSIKPYRVHPLPEHGLNESAILDPDEPYAASKAAQSMLCVAYAKSYDLPIVTFRCSNLYGPAPCHGPRHGWLTWFCISAAMGRPIEVQGTGAQTRDMLHANDVHRACELALTDAGALRGQVFNLGGGSDRRISVRAAADMLHEMTGVEVRQAPARAMDDDHVFVDCALFRRVAGWVPEVDVVGGLRDTLAWAAANKSALVKLYEGV